MPPLSKAELLRDHLAGPGPVRVAGAHDALSARKIEIAKQTQSTQEFLLIGRTEAAIAGAGVDEALRRAHRYVEAGADAVLMHSKSAQPDEILSFLSQWQHRAPVVVVPTTYYG